MMEKIKTKEFAVIAALIFVAVVPLLFKKGKTISVSEADQRIVIMTPHNETIRREFGEAFSEYWQKKTGKKVFIDWRNPGGTSEIMLVLKGDFQRADERAKEKKIDPSQVGIGMDVFFGGGAYDFGILAKQGHLQPLRVFETHPEWFRGEGGIRKTFTGEPCYDDEKRWVGVCLSEFGICYNIDGLKRIGMEPLTSWDDLSDPRLFGHVALADPTKSGSVAKAFEMLVQQKIHDALEHGKQRPGESRQMMRNRLINDGWMAGLNLIQKISANARYFTDSASKIPHDVSQGDAIAGMCIDFYGRSYNEKLKDENGRSRAVWVSPQGGTSTSVDPIGIFRGATHQELADAFVEFVLSDHGQMLWNSKVGSKNGPKYAALRRLPVRPAVYTPENVAQFIDKDDLPYEGEETFIYQPELTAKLFTPLRHIIKVMCIDAHHELCKAWAKIIENEKKGKVSEHAVNQLFNVSQLSYINSLAFRKLLKTNIDISDNKRRDILSISRKLRDFTKYFRTNYEKAISIAEQES